VASTNKKQKRNLSALPPGLLVGRPKEFLKLLCNTLKKSLDLSHVRPIEINKGSRSVCYVSELVPATLTVSGIPMNALTLYSGETSIWMVVEIDWEPGATALMHHVSLKVHEGQTTETARLCFRAEWDLRDTTSEHAQPHWNVHSPTDISATHVSQESKFKEFAELEGEDTFMNFSESEETLSDIAATKLVGDVGQADSKDQILGYFIPERMHRFHFAMAVDWHRTAGMHSPKVENPEQIANWIAACARYVRDQTAFMRVRT
jgi:hypothetical protein